MHGSPAHSAERPPPYALCMFPAPSPLLGCTFRSPTCLPAPHPCPQQSPISHRHVAFHVAQWVPRTDVLLPQPTSPPSSWPPGDRICAPHGPRARASTSATTSRGRTITARQQPTFQQSKRRQTRVTERRQLRHLPSAFHLDSSRRYFSWALPYF